MLRGRSISTALSFSFIVLSSLSATACDRGREPTTAEEAAAAAGRGLERATKERTLNRLEQLRVVLTRYALDHDGSAPEGSSLAAISAELSPQYIPRLDADDAWGATMTYSSNGRSYSIVSAGPDGALGTEDDLSLRDGTITGGP